MSNHEKFSTQKVCFPVKSKTGKNWELGTRIGGVSKFGEVHLVCENSDCKYVLKCQPISETKGWGMDEEKLKNEIVCHGIASEAGLAPEIVDAWFTKTGCAIVMRALKETVYSRLMNIDTVEEGRDLLNKTLAAIRKLHRAGIVHGDTHLQNIMLDEKNNIMFIDFGFANCSGSALKSTSPKDRKEDYRILLEDLENEMGMYVRNRNNPEARKKIFWQLIKEYVNSSSGKIWEILRE
jgi:tRNA A-37 threonylcarbamoyl transferase component Bud32